MKEHLLKKNTLKDQVNVKDFYKEIDSRDLEKTGRIVLV